MGLLFVFMGVKEPQMEFTLYLGVGFVVYGIWTLFRARRDTALVAQLMEATERKP